MNKKSIMIILTLGVFGIINTEMGVIGILPLLSEYFQVSISEAGLFVSLFALAVAIAGPTMPLMFSGINRKKVMVAVLGIFFASNMIQTFTSNFYIALIARVIPAFFHPVYVSLAFTVAASTVSEQEAPKAVSKVMIGVSTGMVLGVPIVSFIANTVSLRAAMLTFAVVNALVLIITCFFVPSLPVTEKLTYGKQIVILKQPIIWLSIVAVIFLNGAIFGVYSFFAEYLTVVTKIPEQIVSIMLLVYGLANILGNILAGRCLSKSAIRFVGVFPFLLLVVYAILFFIGQFTVSTAVITLVWGILAGAGGNINQYWITSVAFKAKDFANGLFLAATNLGTTIGTTICGFFISQMGISYIVVGGMILLVLSLVTILIRIRKYHSLNGFLKLE